MYYFVIFFKNVWMHGYMNKILATRVKVNHSTVTYTFWGRKKINFLQLSDAGYIEQALGSGELINI